MNTQPTARNYAFDAARVFAILTVFTFHMSRFFDTGGWHIKNPVRYDGMDIWVGFLGNWLMPLIFLVSGAGLFYALQRPNALRFLKDKVLRLLVPLAFGATTHVALQVYLERRAHGGFTGSFFEFYPHYFDGLYRLGGNFAWMGLHLWYLEVLFVFSVLLLPVFLWLRSRRGATVLGAVARFLALPGLVFLLAVPGALLFPQLNPSSMLFGNSDWGGWALPMYLPYLLGGFMIGSSVELQERIRRQRFLSLGIALVLTAVLIPLTGSPGDEAFGSPMYVLVGVLSCFASWAYVMMILGLCLKHLNRPSPLLARANQAVLPFYILHQSVMIGLGWFIVRWPIPDLAKFVLIAAATLVICLGSYELIIRRFHLTRFLFGIKPLPRPAAVAAEPAPEPAPAARRPQPAAIASAETGQRRVLALDWVRVLAICVVFLFHSIRAFTVEGWQVHNAVSYEGLDIVTGVVSTWMMPIIFVVSGASLTLSLRGGRPSSGRGGVNFGRLLRTRLLRLAVPFVVGLFTHVALQVYLDRVSTGDFTGSFLDFYPHYFEGMYGAGGNFAWDGLHLWYLLVLLAFTLLSLPLLAWMKSRTGETVVGWMTARLTGVWAPLALAIPVALVTGVLAPGGPLAYSNGGWSAGAYLMFYLAGLLVVPNPAVWKSLQRYRRITLASTVGLVVLLLACVLTWGDPVPGTPYYIAGMSLRAVGAWLGLAAALGFAGTHLERDSAFRSRANEAVLVVYILHQTVLVTVGFFVLRWPIPDPAKYVIILVSSIAIVAGLYEGVVRRWNLMRFLFGMKPLPRSAIEAAGKPAGLSSDRRQEQVSTAMASGEPAQRRVMALDWIRILAIAGVFLFHSTRFFTVESWHVHNAVSYPALDTVADVASTWMMPLVFVVSGASVMLSLRGGVRKGSKRGERSRLGTGLAQLVGSKLLRLLVPLVVGMLTHAALQIYLERVSRGEFVGSFLEFYPHYFDGLYMFGGNFAWMGMHLWYLEFLLVFTLLCLPILAWARSEKGARAMAGVNARLAGAAGPLVMAIPIFLVTSTFGPDDPLGMQAGGWGISAYLCFFILGMLIVPDPQVWRAFQARRWWALAATLVLVAGGLVAVRALGDPEFGTASYAAVMALRGAVAWFGLAALMGFAGKHLERESVLRSQANEAVLPVYILHQTVLLTVGFFVLRWPIPDPAKYVIILVSSIAIVAGLYEGVVQRWNIMRFLFGMKPRVAAASRQPVAQPTVLPDPA